MLARMNRLLTLVAAGVMLGVAPLAHAFFTLDFDENGNASISENGGAFVPLAGVLAPDPSNGGILALTYFLPASQTPVGNGTVTVLEPDESLSDAIRFTDANGALTGGSADRMIYYSDNTDGGTDLADTGFPANLGSGAQGGPVFETGPEGNNGFFYGFGAGQNNYNGISDSVPEPGTLLLLGIGLVLARPAMRRWGR
jgi:hypothetical protein